MNYDSDTRNAYRNPAKARDYQEQYTKGTRWARFTMWRQRRLIERLLAKCALDDTSAILDIPCGTGFIGDILCRTPATVVASDISREMMDRAAGEYGGDKFSGFVQCDITMTPFRGRTFDCILLLAFMHRLPEEIRHRTWKSAIELSRGFIIVNYSIDSRAQRLKQWLLRAVNPKYIPAPSPLSMREIVREIESFGLRVRQTHHIALFLSGKVMFLLEPRNEHLADQPIRRRTSP